MLKTHQSVQAVALAAIISVVGNIGIAQAQSVEWDVSLWGKRRAFTENVEKLSELVAQKTNGDFVLNISYGGLSKPKENLDGIAIGAFQMAQFCSFYHADKNPSITVTELPFSKELTLAQVAEIQAKVFAHPVVKKDLGRWGAALLMPTPLPQYNIVSKTEPLNALQDFKGMRIRGPGGIMGVLSKLGAIKTGVPFTEVRQSMDSGVIDAASFAPHAHLATNSFRVGKWATTNLNLGTANCPVVVNTESLNALSANHREILLGSVAESLRYYVDNYERKTTQKYAQELAESGLKQITFSPSQTAELKDLSESVRRDWVAKYQGKFAADEVFQFTKNLIESY